MALVLEKLLTLKENMEQQDWTIDAFEFRYKRINHIVLVRRYLPGMPKPEKALVQLTFLYGGNPDQKLECPANRYNLIIDEKKVRDFFDINKEGTKGFSLYNFAIDLAKSIPDSIQPKTSKLRDAMAYSLSKSDSTDPAKIYCFDARYLGKLSNGKAKVRSPYNTDKTKLLRPDLYNLLGGDQTYSFHYSTDPSLEETDSQIMRKVAQRERH